MLIPIVRSTPEANVIQRRGRQNREFYKDSDIRDTQSALERAGHQVIILEGDVTLVPRLQELSDDARTRGESLLVFNLAYGVQGECRYTHVPSILELHGIPYVASGPLAHTVALDKYLSKVVMRHAGLPTPDFQLLTSADEPLSDAMTYPLIVKPQFESTSFGLRVVHDQQALQDAVQAIVDQFQQPALVEAFVPGQEVNCGVLGNAPPRALPVLEIDFTDGDASSILTFEAKRDRVITHVCPARIPNALASQIQRLSVEAFRAIGCRDCARADFRIDENGQPHILEINSMAAIHRFGSYFDAAKVAGMSYAELINAVVDAAAERYGMGEGDTATAAAGQ